MACLHNFEIIVVQNALTCIARPDIRVKPEILINVYPEFKVTEVPFYLDFLTFDFNYISLELS